MQTVNRAGFRNRYRFNAVIVCKHRLSGLSPFMGDTDQETLSNVTACDVDFDDECFDDISNEAKQFIVKLLLRQEK